MTYKCTNPRRWILLFSVFICLCVCTYVRVHTCVRACTCMYGCVRNCMSACVCMRMCARANSFKSHLDSTDHYKLLPVTFSVDVKVCLKSLAEPTLWLLTPDTERVEDDNKDFHRPSRSHMDSEGRQKPPGGRDPLHFPSSLLHPIPQNRRFLFTGPSSGEFLTRLPSEDRGSASR